MEIEIPSGTAIGPDGTITLPSDKFGSLKLPGAEASLPGGTIITPDGTVKLPPEIGSSMTTSAGTKVELPGGTVVWPDGTITMPTGKTAKVKTSDGKVEANVSGGIKVETDSTIALFGGVKVTTTDGTKIEFASGSMIEDDDGATDQYLFVNVDEGNALVTNPDGKTKTVAKGSSIRLNSDGSINAKGKGDSSGCNVGLAILAIIAVGSVMVFRRKKI
jgi:uncharacterized cupin superfamily protein